MKRQMMQVLGMMAVVMMYAVVTLFGGTGCAVQARQSKHTHTVKATPKAKAKPNARCRVLGKAKTSHMGVVVERNCLKNGVTTATIMVLNREDNGRVAADHAAQAVISILRFRPELALVLSGKAKGYVFYVMAVTGAQSLALRK